MRAVIFPGQGSQRIGMGAELFEEFPELVARADAVLGYSLRELCEEGPLERLTATQNTQPAVFAINALAYMRWRREGAEPEYLLGHSVAEYNALVAAGVLDFEAGLRLVARRGELMGQAEGGGMAAVLGLDEAAVARVLEEGGLATVHAANLNSPSQVVVSGPREDVLAAEEAFLRAGASRYVPLKVSAAFHSPYMREAREAFARDLAAVDFRAPRVPVISNVTARPHVPGRLRERMAEQITAPVRWCESVRYLLAQGLAPADFHEVGPGPGAIVKPMVVRTARQAGPLDPAQLEAEAPAHDEAPASEEDSGAAPAGTRAPSAEGLGSPAFRERFGVRLAVLAGGMYRGIASADVVVRMARAGLLGFFGVGGLPISEVAEAIRTIQASVPPEAPYGVNFLAHHTRPEAEEELTDLLLETGVRTIEASAFMQVTPALARYRAKGLRRLPGGGIEARNRVLAKVSRPDVAAHFLRPAPPEMVSRLRDSGAITAEEAELLGQVPVADALCVEADSGGHTDQGMPYALFPSILRQRDRLAPETAAFGPVHVGAAGGIGTPEAAAAAFVMGADFVLLGSVNQCTVEAGTSDLVKDMLQDIDVQDTAYAPSGALFEMGATVQVLKKGVFFPARANKLLQLYRQHDALEDLPADVARQVQDRYLKRSFGEVWEELQGGAPAADLERAERLPKHRMGMVFKRYFRYTTRWALAGEAEHKVDFQVHCGPALGAFNQWVRGSELEPWRARHVDAVATHLLEETAALLSRRLRALG